MEKSANKNKENTWFNTKVAFFFIISIVAIIFFAFASYSIFITTDQQESTNRLTTGCFSTSFSDSNIISISNALPTPDSTGLASTPYSFTLTNTCTIKVSYKVIINVLNSSFGDQYVQTSIDGTTAKTLNTYTVNTEKKKESVIVKVTIDYSEVKLSKLAKDNPGIEKSVKNDKLSLSDAKKIYTNLGATCDK